MVNDAENETLTVLGILAKHSSSSNSLTTRTEDESSSLSICWSLSADLLRVGESRDRQASFVCPGSITVRKKGEGEREIIRIESRNDRGKNRN